MRPLESVFLLLDFACAVLTGSRTRAQAGYRRRDIGLLAMAVIMAFVQICVEGFRWQMSFAYLALFLLVLQSAMDDRQRKDPESGPPGPAPSIRATMSGQKEWALALLTLSTVLALAVPVATLPEPKGRYEVGTKYYRLIDGQRRDIFSTDAAQKREIMIQLWYPASAYCGGEIAPFMPYSDDMSVFLSSPFFAVLASHLHLIETHSHLDVPVAPEEARYPLLIFSHGLLGGRIQNTVQAEDLASHGYVVAGVDHTYDCAFAIFPDKNICSSLISFGSKVPSLIDDTAIGVRAKDVQLVFDQLQKLSRANQSPNAVLARIDYTEVGVYGHSLGGETAMLTCSRDNRFKAGLSMDGFYPLMKGSIRQPFMFMQSDRGGDPLGIDEYCRQMQGPHYDLKLEHSGHANFTDLPLITPMHWVIGLSGSIDGRRAMNVIDAYSLAFFDRHLKHRPAPLLDGPSSDYKEIKFEK